MVLCGYRKKKDRMQTATKGLGTRLEEPEPRPEAGGKTLRGGGGTPENRGRCSEGRRMGGVFSPINTKT